MKNNIIKITHYTNNRHEEHERVMGIISDLPGFIITFKSPNKEVGMYSRDSAWVITAYLDRAKLGHKLEGEIRKQFAPIEYLNGVISAQEKVNLDFTPDNTGRVNRPTPRMDESFVSPKVPSLGKRNKHTVHHHHHYYPNKGEKE